MEHRRYGLGALLCVGTVLACSPAALADEADASGVCKGLKAYLAGALPGSKITVTYTDLHGLHGGLRLTIDGTGKVEQQAVRTKAGVPRRVSNAQFRALVQLLLETAAWEQRVPDRTPVPDESRASLTIVAGDARSTIWEWYNDLKPNNRLIRIREKMKSIAWSPEPRGR